MKYKINSSMRRYEVKIAKKRLNILYSFAK